ncbi:RHS repeat-associated core domain-containing protein [Streptomyces sp. MK37H]|nr:RHS repeat-associated core domain-containing protein [Streptomyces sp. MK37H]
MRWGRGVKRIVSARGVLVGSRARRGRWLGRVAAVAGLSLVPGLLSPVTFESEAKGLGRPKLEAPRADEVIPLSPKMDRRAAALVKESEAADRSAAEAARRDQARKVTWPKAGTARLAVSDNGSAKARPGGLPVTLGAVGREVHATPSLSIQVMDQGRARKAGVKGVLLKAVASAEGGSTKLGISYADFAAAYGGDWAGRLTLLQLPACALTTPQKTGCRAQSPLRAVNKRHKEQLSTPLTFAAKPGGEVKVLAVAAAAKSGGGDYRATPLSASSTWEAGGSSGSFTWTYPLGMPPAAAGPAPDLSISYDSGSVDGRTANTNNQGSWIGEGFDLTSSYIERKYGNCNDDGQDDKFDLCWKYDNASLVLNGKATELVKDDTSGTWRLKNDDASTVQHSTGADNGDDNGEYWTVTTGDGTKYVFGLNKLDGAAADDRTESVWTVPVFGDDEGEPGYSSGSSFGERDKRQAWRWNLDYVEDTHNNAMTYWYNAEHNNYAKNGKDDPGTNYIRGGYLKEIRYGQRADALFSATPSASNKVTFTAAERCVASGTGCDSLNEDHRDNWPDVPFDAVCKDGDKCTGNVGPSFFTRKRLTDITTYFWNADAPTPAYEPVDSWALKQTYLDPGDTGDSSDQSLWLDEIKRTGKRGSDIPLDPVKFTHTWLTNRVDGATDDILSLDKPRVKAITSEAGAQTIVDYAEADCVAGRTMPKADENTKRCFPVFWSPNGAADPQLDWFQKYPVTGVRTTDPKGGSEAVVHSYTYEGGAAWHYNDDPMTPAKQRTWSEWRGYGKVIHRTGAGDGTQSRTVTVYLRGMDGDRVLTPDGKGVDPDKRKTVTVTGITAAEITDSDPYAGFTRESVTYNGDAEVSGSISDPWSKRTATQHKSYADTEAYYVRTRATHDRTRITSGISPVDRVRTQTTTYDDFGMPATVEDGGDDAVSGDETCTRNWYARNDKAGISSLIARAQTVSRKCSVTAADLDLPADSSRRGDVVSDVATAYDSTTWSEDQTPTRGEIRWTGRAKGYADTNDPSWQKVETTTYDTLGRPKTVKDALDRTNTTTAYTPETAGPLTSTVTADAKGFTTITAVDPARGSPLKVTDPNKKITKTEYDSLGRVTKVWLPNRSSDLDEKPNYVYDYKVTNASLPWISTGTLKGDGSGYNTTYEIFDSLLRPRQTQEPSPVGGRVISQTLYDDRGLPVSSQADIWDEKNGPSGEAVETDGGQAPTQTDTKYDGAGRPVQAVTKVRGTDRWTTTTTYTGDTAATTAPAGGSAVAEVTNALGRVTERREYPGTSPTGTKYTTTKFTYTPDGDQKTIVGPDNATWTYTYDLFGRLSTADDPDKGKTSTHYDELDHISSTDDANKNTLLYEYDELGRNTGMWQSSKTAANKLASWTFDTLAKGQQDSATRYEGGVDGKAYTRKVTRYNSLYQPTDSQLLLPGNDPLVQAGVPSTLAFFTDYRLDGTVKKTGEPAVGGLSGESVSYTYNATGQQLTTTGASSYLLDAVYSPVGDLRQLELGTSPASDSKKLYTSYEYEDGTRRLTRGFTRDETYGYLLQDLKYTQDDAGNVTSIFDSTNLGGTGKADYQCFGYDGYRRLAEAWTPKAADCADSGRTAANLGGAAPYWTSYTYNVAGQRESETQHAVAGDTTTTYAYGTAKGQPHPLAGTRTTKPGSTPPATAAYTYDAAGNTTTRPGTQAEQTLAWNTEGRLAASSEPAKGGKAATGTGYLYDADGELLIRRATTADGDTVLYLGATEVRLTAQGSAKTLTGTRYYTGAGQTIAERTGTKGQSTTKLTFLAADHHGTGTLAVDVGTRAVSKRYTTPFGAPRGTKPTTWPDDKAFLGKPADGVTGLTHIGAREYDPVTGQFISLDPLLTPDQGQSLNGYSYANQNPVTDSDPTGLCVDPGNGHCMPTNGGDAGKNAPPENHYPSGGGRRHGGGGGGGGSGGGTASTSASYPTPAPSPGPPPVPGPYHDEKAGTGLFSVLKLAVDFFGPDTSEWKKCGDFKLSGCLWAAADLPGPGKALKGVKIWKKARKAEKKADDAVDAAEKAVEKCHSFTGETQVELADGSHSDIEDIKVGDKVLATDPETGKSEARPVVATIVTNDDKDFTDLTVKSGDRPASIIATDTHPFWVTSEARWVDAGDVITGMPLRTDKGEAVTVTSVRHFTKLQRTYDLTVSTIHTYYVLAGETPVLVHNSSCRRDAQGRFTSGENAEAARGRLTHKNYRTALGDGYDYEVTLPSGRRPDAIDWENRVVRELKSDAPSSMATGRRQLKGYVEELEEMTGQSWTGHLDIYKRFD